MTSLFGILFVLLLVLSALNSLASGQICGDVFAIANPEGDVQLQIAADGTFTACNGTNVCNILSQSIQQLTLENGILSISHGNGVALPDTSNVNEIQTLEVNNETNELTITNGNTVTIDTSASNELQNLVLDGDQLTITNGNSVTLPEKRSYFASLINGPDPTLALTLISTTVNVTTTLPQQKVFVTSTAVVGLLDETGFVSLCLCYQLGLLPKPIPSEMCLSGVKLAPDTRIPITISAIFEPPQAGTWRVGLCGALESVVNYSVTGNYVTAVVL